MGCQKDNACKQSRSEAAVHFVPPIYSDGRAITLVGQAQSLLADSRRATIKRLGGLEPCNFDLCQYRSRTAGRGFVAVLELCRGSLWIRVRASSVESCPTMALNLQCRERARIPYWSDSDKLEGRSGLRWDVREDSLRPSALSKARLDARGHSGTESREPPTYQRIKAADRVDKATSNQICSPSFSLTAMSIHPLAAGSPQNVTASRCAGGMIVAAVKESQRSLPTSECFRSQLDKIGVVYRAMVWEMK